MTSKQGRGRLIASIACDEAPNVSKLIIEPGKAVVEKIGK